MNKNKKVIILITTLGIIILSIAGIFIYKNKKIDNIVVGENDKNHMQENNELENIIDNENIIENIVENNVKQSNTVENNTISQSKIVKENKEKETAPTVKKQNEKTSTKKENNKTTTNIKKETVEKKQTPKEKKNTETNKENSTKSKEVQSEKVENIKSIYDYEFDISKIKSELISIGQSMGLKHRTSDDGVKITPSNSSWANPVTASKNYQGKKLERALKDYVKSMPSIVESYGGEKIKNFTIYVENRGNGSYTFYFLY